ncbi:sensor histidine kinase [Paracrocinitomix mangrovi]|uniref:tetratricopeptide repeat-containing sensor histidine kinase n=1 Tax=Paracrocinitomix mangrovi TaxID=2862509 RepID=UPI001C8DC8AF|nr:sensor histidine kinase [Paracrocinitomix mangrovi]UKN00290.1 sensor histidine kinase [Paracrocinitomix mangrovi]
MKRSLVLFMFFLFASFVHSQEDYKADSTMIAQNFLKATMGLSDIDSIKNTNRQVAQTPRLKDVYQYHLCRYFFMTSQVDSVILYANQAIPNVSETEAAKYYNLVGSAFSVKGDYDVAIEQMLKAKVIYEKNGDHYKAAIIENNLANVFFSLKQYESSYQYAFSAYNYLSEINDTIYYSSVASIAAVSAIKLDSIEQGEELSQEALNNAIQYNNPIGQIIAFYAKGELLQKKDSVKEAVDMYDRSMILSRQFGQTHYVMLNHIALLHAYSELQLFNEAIVSGEEALKLSKSQNNDNTLYSIHKQLGYAYAGKGEFKKAFENMALANELYVEFAGIESREIINEMMVKYETEKKERALAEEQLKSLKSEQKLANRNWWILLLASGVLVLAILLYFLRRSSVNRIQRLKLVQEHKIAKAAVLGEEKERERVAADLHDGVASSLTAAKIQLELLASNKEINLNEVLNQINKTHLDVRRISHNLMPVDFDERNLEDTLKLYCKGNSSDKLVIHFTSNLGDKKVQATKAKMIYRWVQELINNVQKHAKARNCFVQLLMDNNKIVLSVEDDGIGFDLDDNVDGIGIVSIQKRVENLGGEIIFESAKDKGTLVSIYLNLTE